MKAILSLLVSLIVALGQAKQFDPTNSNAKVKNTYDNRVQYATGWDYVWHKYVDFI